LRDGQNVLLSDEVDNGEFNGDETIKQFSNMQVYESSKKIKRASGRSKKSIAAWGFRLPKYLCHLRSPACRLALLQSPAFLIWMGMTP
jgi:hypothetical protein